jgi:cysteinyl-tRNA synthetase
VNATGPMELKLYDTLTREKRVFSPIDPNNVRMYVCGPTVYDFAHIGNARPVIVFDVLYRLLRHVYGATHVKYVRNITDVDDKINARAAERGISIRDLTEETYRNFKEDVTALGCLPPDVEPRATEHIEEMKTLIERLVAENHAYVAEEHVLFSVPSMQDYGKLARRSLDEMMAGARVDVAPYKRDPMDFVLWKPSKPGEPSWPSPSGIKTPGRPGWHIECSAMSWKHLGETFDIHGGGIDLVFPHHENEIAQSCCTFHKPVMANFWMHNGFLQVEGEKMSKSLGNFVIIREVLADWPGDVVRLAMLGSHYRQPINWTVKGLEEAEKALSSFYDAASAEADPRPAPGVLDALLDDLNTPKAIAEMHGLKNAAGRRGLAGTLGFFGFRPDELKAWQAAHAPQPSLAKEEIESRIAARNAARKARNFAESDRIRDELAARGVVLKDSKDGTTWEVAR